MLRMWAESAGNCAAGCEVVCLILSVLYHAQFGLGCCWRLVSRRETTPFTFVTSPRTFRQYYSYVTDTQCKRVGTQCWVFW